MPLTRVQTQTNIGAGLSRVEERAGSSGLGGLRRTLGRSKKDQTDLESVEGLLALARAKGLDDEIDGVPDKPKLSVLQRLITGLGSLNPAEAIMKQINGTEKFLTAYPKEVIQGIGAALTGNDYGEQTKRRYFSDLVEHLGVENKIARFGLGLVGDILLDPSTYVGGTFVRGGLKGVQIVARPVLRTAGKVAAKVLPEVTVEAGRVAGAKLVEAGVAVKQAFGSMFVHGYGATKGVANKFLMFQGKRSNVLKGLAISNAKRYGNDILTDSQWEEFVDKLFTGKNAEFDFYDKMTDDAIEAFNKKFPQLKFPLADRKTWAKKLEKADPEAWKGASAAEQELMVKSAIRTNVVTRMESTVRTTSKKIGKLQEMRQRLAKPFIADDLLNLKGWTGELRKELNELLPSKTIKKTSKTPYLASKAEQDASLANALSMEKDQLKKTILNLQSRIDGIEKGIIKPAERKIAEKIAGKTKHNIDDIIKMTMRELDPELRIKDAIVEMDQNILKLTNEMFEKQGILERVLQGKQVAKDMIKKAFDIGDFGNLPMDLAAALRPISDDPAVQKAIVERLARNTELAKQAGIESPYAVYAPSIKAGQTEKQRVMSFLNGTRRLAVGSEGYKKEFKNLLREEELLRDRSLFLRVEDQVATNNLTQSFFKEILDDIGKPINAFKNEGEAAQAGFKMLKTKGIYGENLGWIPEGDWRFFNGQMGDTYGAIDAIAKGTGFDSLNSLFKRFVTGPFASFHVRNWTSGKIQNFEMLGEAALRPKTLAAGNRLALKISRGAFNNIGDYFEAGISFGKKVAKFGNETITLHGKPYLMDDIGQAIQDRFAHSSFYQQDFNSVVREADVLADSGLFSKEAWKSWGKKAVDLKRPGVSQIEALVGQDMPIFRGARVVGSYVELSQKSEAVVGALTKGHTLDEALEIAEKAGFDYRKITPFEAKIMRRIVPFYTFMRKNLELQLKTLGTHPERINQVIRSIENVQNLWETRLTEEEKKNLPTYLREYLSVPAGRSDEGLPIFVRSFGTPIEAFTNLVKTTADGKSSWERTFLSTLSQVTPYIKAPIEFAIGQDSFRQRDIQEVYNAKEYKDAPEFIKDFLKLKSVQKKSAEGKPYTIYAADPNRYLIMRSLFTSRGFTYVNNIFNEDIPSFLRIMESLSGIQSDEVNTEFYRSLSDRQQQEQISSVLRRYGIISEFNKLFIPKKK